MMRARFFLSLLENWTARGPRLNYIYVGHRISRSLDVDVLFVKDKLVVVIWVYVLLLYDVCVCKILIKWFIVIVIIAAHHILIGNNVL